MLSMCILAQHTVLFIICRFSCQASQPVVCHQGTNAYTYQLKSLLSIDLGLYLCLNKDLLSKCRYEFCSDGIYIIKMSKQWAQDTSIRMKGKGTSTVQSLYSTLYKRLFHWTVFVTQEVHTVLSMCILAQHNVLFIIKLSY